jgi:hypothetical protein
LHLIFVVGDLVGGCGSTGIQDLDLGFEVADSAARVLGGVVGK